MTLTFGLQTLKNYKNETYLWKEINILVETNPSLRLKIGYQGFREWQGMAISQPCTSFIVQNALTLTMILYTVF